VLEAAALGVEADPRSADGRGEGVLELTVELTATTSHRVPLSKLKTWLESSGRDPREAAIKTRLK